MVEKCDLDIDPLADARIRGLKTRRRLEDAEGGLVSVKEFALKAGMSQTETDLLRRQGRLIAISLGGDSYAYPVWQVGLAGIEVVVQRFKGNPYGQLLFILNGNAWLDGLRPLDALRAGRVEEVRQAIEMYGEQCAV